MIVQPKVRGFICTAAHPGGCAAAVKSQIEYVKSQDKLPQGPSKVLVIGCSTGYGLATRIVSAFAGDAATLGICFEKPAAGKRTASPGWYNTAAFEEAAGQAGLYAKTLNGDAFSHEMKQQVIEVIKRDLDKVDAVIYSLASPRRVDPDTGHVYQSTLKTIGKTYTNQTVDALRGELKQVSIDSASAEDIDNTIAVMGGADLQLWIDALQEANVLADGVQVLAYSYIGPELTFPIYRDGTIGKAKDDLKKTCDQLQKQLEGISGRATIAVNKAVVTQASAAIPVVPLYISVLSRVLKEKGLQEGCIEQMYRLAKDATYAPAPYSTDAAGMIRVDDWEMRDDVQQEVSRIWSQLTSETLDRLTDLKGYQDEFFQLFGFRWPGIDYEADVEVNHNIPSIVAEIKDESSE